MEECREEIIENNEKLFPNEISIYFPDNKELFKDEPILSNGIEKITFGDNFNNSLGHSGYGTFLPETLKILELSGKFDQEIDLLPEKLITLHFMKNCVFNRSISSLPMKLEILRFGDKFNSAIFYLPPNLKILEFGNDFNQPINPLILPKKMFTICFGNSFNQYLDDLPDSIENIKLGNNFNKDLKLPRNVKYVEFGRSFDQKQIFDELPESIKNIKICSSFLYIEEIKEKYGNIIHIKNYNLTQNFLTDVLSTTIFEPPCDS